MELISADTGITIGLVVTLLGGVVWLTKLHGLASENRKTLRSMQKRMDTVEAENSNIADRMARIETKIDFLINEIQKQHP